MIEKHIDDFYKVEPFTPSGYKHKDYKKEIGLDLVSLNNEIELQRIKENKYYSGTRELLPQYQLLPQLSEIVSKNQGPSWENDRLISELETFINTDIFFLPVTILASVIASNKRDEDRTNEERLCAQSILSNFQSIKNDIHYGEQTAPFRKIFYTWIIKEEINIRVMLEASLLVLRFLKHARNENIYQNDEVMYKDCDKASRCVYELFVHTWLARNQKWLAVSTFDLLDQLTYEQDNYYLPLFSDAGEYIVNNFPREAIVIQDQLENNLWLPDIDVIAEPTVIESANWDIDDLARTGELYALINSADIPVLSSVNKNVIKTFFVAGLPVSGWPTIIPKNRQEQMSLLKLSATLPGGAASAHISIHEKHSRYYPIEDPDEIKFNFHNTIKSLKEDQREKDFKQSIEISNIDSAVNSPLVFETRQRGKSLSSPYTEEITLPNKTDIDDEKENIAFISLPPNDLVYYRTDDEFLNNGVKKFYRLQTLHGEVRSKEQYLEFMTEEAYVDKIAHDDGNSCAKMYGPNPAPKREDNLPIIDLEGRVFFASQHRHNIITYYENPPTLRELDDYIESSISLMESNAGQRAMIKKYGDDAQRAYDDEVEILYWVKELLHELHESPDVLKLAVGLHLPKTYSRWMDEKYGLNKKGPFSSVYGPYVDDEQSVYLAPGCGAFALQLSQLEEYTPNFQDCNGARIYMPFDVVTDNTFLNGYLYMDGSVDKNAKNPKFVYSDKSGKRGNFDNEAIVRTTDLKLATGEILRYCGDHPFNDIVAKAEYVWIDTLRKNNRSIQSSWAPSVYQRRVIPNPPAHYADTMQFNDWTSIMPPWMLREIYYQPRKILEEHFYMQINERNLRDAGFNHTQIEQIIDYMSYLKNHPIFQDRYDFIVKHSTIGDVSQQWAKKIDAHNKEHAVNWFVTRGRGDTTRDSGWLGNNRNNTPQRQWGGRQEEPEEPERFITDVLYNVNKDKFYPDDQRDVEEIKYASDNDYEILALDPSNRPVRVKVMRVITERGRYGFEFMLYDEFLDYKDRRNHRRREEQPPPRSMQRSAPSWRSSQENVQEQSKPSWRREQTQEQDNTLTQDVRKLHNIPDDAFDIEVDEQNEIIRYRVRAPLGIVQLKQVSIAKKQEPEKLIDKISSQEGRREMVKKAATAFAKINLGKDPRVDENEYQALKTELPQAYDIEKTATRCNDENEARKEWENDQADKKRIDPFYVYRPYETGCVLIKGRERERNLYAVRNWYLFKLSQEEAMVRSGIDVKTNIPKPYLFMIDGKDQSFDSYLQEVKKEIDDAQNREKENKTIREALPKDVVVDESIKLSNMQHSVVQTAINTHPKVKKVVRVSTDRTIPPIAKAKNVKVQVVLKRGRAVDYTMTQTNEKDIVSTEIDKHDTTQAAKFTSFAVQEDDELPEIKLFPSDFEIEKNSYMADGEYDNMLFDDILAEDRQEHPELGVSYKPVISSVCTNDEDGFNAAEVGMFKNKTEKDDDDKNIRAFMSGKNKLSSIIGDKDAETYIASCLEIKTLNDLAKKITTDYANCVRLLDNTKKKVYQLSTIQAVDQRLTDYINNIVNKCLGINFIMTSFSSEFSDLHDALKIIDKEDDSIRINACQDEIIENALATIDSENAKVIVTEDPEIPVTFFVDPTIYVKLDINYSQLGVTLDKSGTGCVVRKDPNTSLLGSMPVHTLLQQFNKLITRSKKDLPVTIKVKTMDGKIIHFNPKFGDSSYWLLSLRN